MISRKWLNRSTAGVALLLLLERLRERLGERQHLLGAPFNVYYQKPLEPAECSSLMVSARALWCI